MADEYDAAQDRGEVASGRPKSIPGENSFQPTASDIGLTAKVIHEARIVRDATSAPLSRTNLTSENPALRNLPPFIEKCEGR